MQVHMVQFLMDGILPQVSIYGKTFELANSEAIACTFAMKT